MNSVLYKKELIINLPAQEVSEDLEQKITIYVTEENNGYGIFEHTWGKSIDLIEWVFEYPSARYDAIEKGVELAKILRKEFVLNQKQIYDENEKCINCGNKHLDNCDIT